MAYIGNQPAESFTSFATQEFSTSATTSYTLDHAVTNENEIALFVNNVRQQPGSGKAYTATGTALTLSAATASTDTMYCVFLGRALQTVTPATNSITNTMLSENSQTQIFNNNFRNIIINGDMSIAQRGTSFTGLTNGSTDYTVDRFKFNESGSMTSVFTFSQDTDVPSGQGFAKSLKIQNTTAGSGHNVVEAIQFIEAQNLQYLKFGTSSAENLTLSFWVKCSETGTGNVSIYNLDATRQIAKNYTINSANTWEKKTLSIPGDTSGSFNNDNGGGLGIYFALAASSGYNGGTPGSWGSYSDGLRGAGMTIDLTNSTSDNIYITGVQLEAGTTATNFEFLPHDVNLQRCSRYCFSVPYAGGDTYHGILQGFFPNTTLFIGDIPLPTRMRDSISLTTSGSFHVAGNTDYAASSFNLQNVALENSHSVEFRCTVSGATAGQAARFRNNNDATAKFILTSEL